MIPQTQQKYTVTKEEILYNYILYTDCRQDNKEDLTNEINFVPNNILKIFLIEFIESYVTRMYSIIFSFKNDQFVTKSVF